MADGRRFHVCVCVCRFIWPLFSSLFCAGPVSPAFWRPAVATPFPVSGLAISGAPRTDGRTSPGSVAWTHAFGPRSIGRPWGRRPISAIRRLAALLLDWLNVALLAFCPPSVLSVHFQVIFDLSRRLLVWLFCPFCCCFRIRGDNLFGRSDGKFVCSSK